MGGPVSRLAACLIRTSSNLNEPHTQLAQALTCITRMTRMKTIVAFLMALLFSAAAPAQVDAGQAAWDGLVKKHVKWLPDGNQSRVDYAGFAKDRAELKKVLDALSAVPRAEFDAWPQPQRMAFLINAYNAFTVELILTKYPDLKSIKDLGSFVQSPWKKKFFTLLGEPRYLDWIEHEQLRPLYADPRVHAAVNCASIGCPALRNEAFTAAKLEAQLDDGMQRFMSDRTRNRAKDGKLEVNSIFKWFGEDFEKGDKGFSKLEDVFAKYATQLSDNAADQERLKAKSLAVNFLDYDWSLNAIGR
jgi:hypothetical protein